MEPIIIFPAKVTACAKTMSTYQLSLHHISLCWTKTVTLFEVKYSEMCNWYNTLAVWHAVNNN